MRDIQSRVRDFKDTGMHALHYYKYHDMALKKKSHCKYAQLLVIILLTCILKNLYCGGGTILVM